MHRGAPANVDAARAFRQGEECCLIGDADVAGGCEFEPAPDRRSVQCGDYRNAALAQ